MPKTPDKLEAGMLFCTEPGTLYMLVERPDGTKLTAVYLNSEARISLAADGTATGVDVVSFTKGDKYLGKIDCKQLKLKLKELINDEET